MAVFRSEIPSAGGVVELGPTGRVVGFDREARCQPVSNLVNAGVYAFSPEVLDEISAIATWAYPARYRVRRTAATGRPRYCSTGRRLLPRHRYAGGVPPSQRGVARTGRAMIITQTPLRIGLLGGGTDLPGYYIENGGRVLNCAIDKYIYVIVKERFDEDIYLNYSKKEIVSRVEEIEHEFVREAMLMTGVTRAVEITTLADIPSAGSGLGSSSAVTVGLLHALFAYQGRQVTAEELAGARVRDRDRTLRQANWQTRSVHCRLTAASEICASVQATRWSPRSWTCQPRPAGRSKSKSCCFTRASRGALTQSWLSRMRTSRVTGTELDLLRDLAGYASDQLRGGDVDAIGPAVRESWEAKRKLASGVSNDHIEQAIIQALDAGATGVKLTGAWRRRLPARHLPNRAAACSPGQSSGHAGASSKAGPAWLARRTQRPTRYLGLNHEGKHGVEERSHTAF